MPFRASIETGMADGVARSDRHEAQRSPDAATVFGRVIRGGVFFYRQRFPGGGAIAERKRERSAIPSDILLDSVSITA